MLVSASSAPGSSATAGAAGFGWASADTAATISDAASATPRISSRPIVFISFTVR